MVQIVKMQINLKTSIASINEQMAKITNDISTLNSKFTGLFEVVTELPDINNAQLGKIYCIKDTFSSEDDNKYIEWVKIMTTDDTYKFEKIGEFKAEPDLSGYARLDVNNFFDKNVSIGRELKVGWSISVNQIRQFSGRYLQIDINPSPTKTYVTDGTIAEIGTEENLVFTLENGSTVTKKIRVLSSTTTPAT